MLRILTLVFLCLSLFFWLATNYTANLCVESISELYASSQGTAHKHPETKEEGGNFADPPTNGDEVQGCQPSVCIPVYYLALTTCMTESICFQWFSFALQMM